MGQTQNYKLQKDVNKSNFLQFFKQFGELPRSCFIKKICYLFIFSTQTVKKVNTNNKLLYSVFKYLCLDFYSDN